MRKPGAFRLYKYREDLFPSLTFRKAYDRLCEIHDERTASLEYLRILHLAASTVESEVEAAVDLALEDGSLRSADRIKELAAVSPVSEPPSMRPARVDLASYDRLLGSRREAIS